MLDVKDLKVHFHNAAPDRFAVGGISFHMEDGEILGLVGESGSGKTVTAMAITGLLPRKSCEYTGEIRLDGKDLLHCSRHELRQMQGTDMGVIFQQPMSAFDPVMRIGPQVEESLLVHRPEMAPEERKAAAVQAMAEAELPDPEALYTKYPHELTGGMLQRAMIAAAIIHEPKLLIADEPTTALDVTIQGQILDLLKKINKARGTSILFISHNLKVVRKLCHRVIVLQRGVIVEEGEAEELFRHPRQEYTRILVESIPTREKHLRQEEPV